mmetsp:Transcript_26250/g.36146  ORF Transcript_26250/g.36146 Transcript_26250/m.36146 type:complete len:398 (-) Transcript_26250:2215-3408(-)
MSSCSEATACRAAIAGGSRRQEPAHQSARLDRPLVHDQLGLVGLEMQQRAQHRHQLHSLGGIGAHEKVPQDVHQVVRIDAAAGGVELLLPHHRRLQLAHRDLQRIDLFFAETDVVLQLDELHREGGVLPAQDGNAVLQVAVRLLVEEHLAAVRTRVVRVDVGSMALLLRRPLPGGLILGRSGCVCQADRLLAVRTAAAHSRLFLADVQRRRHSKELLLLLGCVYHFYRRRGGHHQRTILVESRSYARRPCFIMRSRRFVFAIGGVEIHAAALLEQFVVFRRTLPKHFLRYGLLAPQQLRFMNRFAKFTLHLLTRGRGLLVLPRRSVQAVLQTLAFNGAFRQSRGRCGELAFQIRLLFFERLDDTLEAIHFMRKLILVSSLAFAAIFVSETLQCSLGA